MSVTVVVNYMTVSHKGSSGLSIAFPDVCKTPILGVPVPIPYPNIAMSSDVSKGSKKVKCDGKKVLLKSSEIKTSMGDEPGVQNGVVSNKIKGKGKFANYSFDVKFEGKNVCRLADPTTQNRGTMNTAAFAHIQKPDVVSAGNAKLVEDACKEVDKKAAEQAEQSDSPASGPGKSGIIPKHWSDMQACLDMLEPKWLIYFRSTSKDCKKWIEKNHEPKPHEWTDGVSLKGGDRRRDLEGPIRHWCDTHRQSKTVKKLKEDGFIKHNYRQVDLDKLYGVVISRRSGEQGRPVLGTKEHAYLIAPGKYGEWMTADYDMMDIVKGDGACERPTAAAYGNLKIALNSAMKWPGIQHPHQAAWNTANDEAFKGTKGDFSVQQNIDNWLVKVGEAKSSAAGAKNKKKAAKQARNAAREVPKGEIAPGRDLKLIDDDLTILGPKAGLALENNEDYWDALACCGCLDTAMPEKDGEDSGAQQKRDEQRKPYEYSEEPDDMKGIT